LTLSENTKYAKQFYDRQYALNKYGARTPDAHPLRRWLGSRITCYNLENAHCLDVGCGRGDLQDIVDDYTGVDISTTVAKCHRKDNRERRDRPRERRGSAILIMASNCAKDRLKPELQTPKCPINRRS
jgi:SAM-dependent methyltransferase